MPLPANRGFTLVELLVSMSLAVVVMAAVFSTYLYLGRNLTRLSYRSTLESQSRKILNTLTTDIRNAKSVVNASATGLSLNVYNQDAGKGPVPLMKVVYAQTTATYPDGTTANKLTRTTSNPDGSGASPSVTLNNDIGDANSQVQVSMTNLNFLYTTTTGNTFTTSGTGPSYQNTTTLVPMSIKQVAMVFVLQAGSSNIQGQQGTQSSYQVASGRMPLMNHPLPDGS